MTQKLEILIADDYEEIRELIGFVIEGHFDANLSYFGCGNDAIKSFASKKYDLIITDLVMPQGTGADIYKFVKSTGLTTPIIMLSGDNVRNHPDLVNATDFMQVAKPFTEEELVTAVESSLKKNRQLQNYIPVNLNLLIKIKNIQTPLFIKINNDKYVKMTPETSTFSKEEFERYQAKGLKYLYIESAEAKKFILEFKQLPLSSEAWDSLDGEDCTQFVKLNAELMKNLVDALGWDQDLVNIATESASRTLVIAKNHQILGRSLKQFQRIERYGYADHCTLTVLICFGIAEALGLTDEIALRKLTFAGIFHDISLTDMQFENKKKNLAYLEKRENLISKDVIDLMAHPANAADVFRKWQVAPLGTDELVLRHHEKPDGSGFPMGLNSDQIDQLSAIMIVAEDFVDFYIESKGEPNTEKFLNSKESLYNSGEFAKVFEALKTSLKD